MKFSACHSRLLFLLAFSMAGPGLAACGSRSASSDEPPEVDANTDCRIAGEMRTRGELLSEETIRDYSRAEIQLYARAIGLDFTPLYGAAASKVTYVTADLADGCTVASGAVVLPVDAEGPRPLVSYQHGTVLERKETPSAGSGELRIGVALASLGHVGSLPDYVGLGASDAFLHPYLHAESEASASLDMLRAATTFAQESDVELDDNLFLIGYSQGGHATMALHRLIEEDHGDAFSVTASSPQAGPYDLSGTMRDTLLASEEHPNPYYVPYLTFAYQNVYGLAESSEALFAAEYRDVIPPLFNGATSSDAINSAMPDVPLEVLSPEFVTSIRDDESSPINQALEKNDVYRWKPAAPMRLYHCAGDQDVPYANSQVAFDYLQEQGAEVELLVPEGTDDDTSHGECALSALIQGAAWFDNFLAAD